MRSLSPSDNAQVTISGDQVPSIAPLSAATAYSIRMRATDSGGLAFEKVFAVTPTPGAGTASAGGRVVASAVTAGTAGGSSGSGGCGLGGLTATLLGLGLGLVARRRRAEP